MQKAEKQNNVIDYSLFALLIVSIVTITSLYVSSERFLYFWDYTNYANQSSELVSAFGVSFLEGLRTLKGSLSTEYNKLPCLPIIPFFIIFGESRLVYILACALVYILPFTLVNGAIATKIIPAYPHAVFWSTTFLTLLISPTWISTLRGYPDIGASAIIGLAILVYLKDTNLTHRWQIPFIGILLALAILFRRHFAYSARAFLGAMVLQGVLVFLSKVHIDRKKALRRLTRDGLAIVLVAATSLVTLAIIAPAFTEKIFTTDYRSLYTSYERSTLENIQYYGEIYGWLAWLLTFLGFTIGIVARVLSRLAIFFIVTFGGLSLVQWVFLSRQVNVHYTTHFTVFVVLGFTSLLWISWLLLHGKARILTIGVGIAFLFVNGIFGLTPAGQFNSNVRTLFAASNPPLVRNDYDTLSQIISYLRTTAINKKPIYVAASSNTLNRSLVQEGEWQLYGIDNSKLNTLTVANIDSRDFYPIEELLQAQYVIVATPFQHHLPPEEQDVVKVAVDAFTEDWEIARDFQHLPEQFVLENNVDVSIYRRTRSTSPATALHTLNIMRERIQPKPGKSYDWMSYGTQYDGTIDLNKKTKTVDFLATLNTEPVSFLYFGTLPESFDVDGTVKSPNCTGFEEFLLRFITLDKAGHPMREKELAFPAGDSKNLSLQLQANNATYLRVDFVSPESSSETAGCSASINDLAISDRAER